MQRTVTHQHFIATYTGRGEFYSGILTGCRVLVQQTITAFDSHDGKRKSSCSISVQQYDPPGAWLTVYNTAAELEDIQPVKLGEHEYAWRHGKRERPANLAGQYLVATGINPMAPDYIAGLDPREIELGTLRAELALRADRPYAGACGESDALEDRIATLLDELGPGGGA